MTAAAPKRKHGLRETVASLGQPKVASMLALGFSSGLPFLLSGATFGFWLADAGTSVTAIGFLSWVGLAYSFKYLWSPLVDRLPLPVLGRLGARRSWAVFTQIVVAGALLAMAAVGPGGPGGLATLGAFALVLAFASATQDIAIDAWRIESASDAEELSLFTSAYQLGYRIALLISDALILIFAQHLGWPMSYTLMALLMGVGLFAALRTPEPERADRAIESKERSAPIWTPRGFADAVIGPFAEFIRAHGGFAIVMLLMIALYRLPEFVIGPVAGPFYKELGLEKDVIGGVRASFGLVASFAGIAAGGVAALRFGFKNTLIVGAILQGVGVAGYALLPSLGPSLGAFATVMVIDNFSGAFGGVVFIAYMSSLTSLGYTATQYALMSSLNTWFGKFFKGFSGAMVDGFHNAGHSMLDAYAIFYVCAGLMAVPAVALCLVLLARKTPPAADGAPG
ncbi:MAG: MFS transporter [Alphaproteobacteria bacterium]|nr:MFS transporter [Alphaproteobacteria bacterium]